LLSNIIINSATGAFTGHVDAGCMVDTNCTNLVFEAVKSLPYLIPGLAAIGRGVSFIVKACSQHPDGGINGSISGKIE